MLKLLHLYLCIWVSFAQFRMELQIFILVRYLNFLQVFSFCLL